MQDLWVALGLVLVIEGVLYALFPEKMLKALDQIRQLPPATLRVTGILAVAIGWLVVWLVRT